MRLPVISISNDPSPEDLVRLYHRTQLHWRRHLGEESVLEIGTAIVNGALRDVPEANCVLDASAPPDMTVQQAADEADEHFAHRHSRCAAWVLNAGSSEQHARPLIAHLLNHGYTVRSRQILHVRGHFSPPTDPAADLTIIPARASFRHARQLADEMSQNDAQRTEAAMLHLDDPHVDALLALKDGAAVASVSVLAVGDAGCIEDLFVSQPFRGRGIAQTMMSRAMEICARSLFKHVFISATDLDADRALFNNLGFERAGTYSSLVRSAGGETSAPAC